MWVYWLSNIPLKPHRTKCQELYLLGINAKFIKLTASLVVISSHFRLIRKKLKVYSKEYLWQYHIISTRVYIATGTSIWMLKSNQAMTTRQTGFSTNIELLGMFGMRMQLQFNNSFIWILSVKSGKCNNINNSSSDNTK